MRGRTTSPDRPGAASGPASTRLRLAAALVVAQVCGELVVVAGRSELTVALRVVLGLVVAAQLVLAVAAVRRSAGAVLGSYAYQLSAVLAAIGAEGPVAIRAALAASACAVVALLASASSAFPPPPLPRGPNP